MDYLIKNIKKDTDLFNYINYLEDFKLTDFIDKIEFIKNKHNKITIYKNNIFELILICWYDVIVPYHNHPQNGCLLKVLDGELIENIKNNNIITKNILYKDNISYMHDNKGQHMIQSINKTISLHLYSPPNYYN